MKTYIPLVGVAQLVIALGMPSPSDACAPAPPPNVVVEVATESAIIIWDAQAKTQHFIRRATFTTANKGQAPVKDFGFLVPTPSIPVLEEADDKAFDELAKITAPKTETRPRPSGGGCEGCGLGCGAAAPKSAGEAPPVEVLAEKHVAGYDAKVLKANDANALTAWLNERGYEIRPALSRWMKPYIEKGWVITAFKIAGGSSGAPSAAVGSAAVRMSFNTETPFFPYSEPDDLSDANTKRLLRVYVIADQKMSVWKNGVQTPWGTPWAGKPGPEGWKGTLPHLKIPGFQPDEGMWLTEFEDTSSPRLGDADLYYRPALDQNPVQRPNRIIYAGRTDAGAAPAFAVLAAVVACLSLSRFLSARVNRRG